MKSGFKNILSVVAVAGTFSMAAFVPAQAQSSKAQSHQSVQQQTSPYQRTLKEIAAFDKATDAKAMMGIVSNIKNNLREEIALTKRQILMDKENGDDSKTKATMDHINQLGQIYNRIVTSSRTLETLNKSEIASALNDYRKLH